jgi:hypothetical protein
MRLLPGEVEKLLAGAGARFRGQGGRFNLYLEYVLEIEFLLEFLILNSSFHSSTPTTDPRAAATQPSICSPLKGRPERGGECS